MISKLRVLQDAFLVIKSKPWPLEKPRVIQFPVNDICNAHCQMCNIWQQKYDGQITSAELKQALANPLFSEVTAIGINGGEPTLRRDLADIVKSIYMILPKVKSISLITNGLLAEKVIAKIVEIGEVVKQYNGTLDVMVSLDGVGKLHDEVRGSQGNFVNAEKVLQFCKKSNLVHSVRIGCTVINVNVYGVHELLEWAINHDIYVKFRLGVPHKRLYKTKTPHHRQIGKRVWLDRDVFDLNFRQRVHFVEFLEGLKHHYEENELQNFFYTSLIEQLLYGSTRIAGCDWQHRGVTLTSKGELLYCAIQSDVLGSAVTDDSRAIYFNNQSHLNEILESKCSSCAHDYMGLPPRDIFFKLALKKIIQKTGIPVAVLKRSRVLQPIKSVLARRRFANRVRYYSKLTNQVKSNRSCKKIFQVMICGWYGTETLGDKAILAGIIESLQHSLGDFEINLVSLVDYISELTKIQMNELQKIKILSVERGLNLVQKMDLVVFGGGPIMAIDNLAEIEVIFLTARNNAVPTFVAGCGIGPLGREYHNASIKRILCFASLRIYRDEKSKKNAEQLGVDTSCDYVSEDPAFVWLNKIQPKFRNRYRTKNRHEIYLLLGLRDWPHREYAIEMGFSQSDQIKKKFEQQVIIALNMLVEKYPNLVIIPLPMCTNHFGSDDRFFYQKLFRAQKTIFDRLDKSVLYRELEPEDYVEKFVKADVSISMRYHSLVFSLGLGLSSVVIDYTLGRGKVKALAEKFNLPCASIDKVSSDFLVNNVSKILDSTGTQERQAYVPHFNEIVGQVLPTIISAKKTIL